LFARERPGRIARQWLLQKGSIGLGRPAEGSFPALPKDPRASVPVRSPGRHPANEIELRVELVDGREDEQTFLLIPYLAMPDPAVRAVMPVPLGEASQAVVGRLSVDDVAEAGLPLLGEGEHVLAQREEKD